MSPGHPLRTLLALVAGLSTLAALAAAPRPAVAQGTTPVTLAGNPDLQADRLALLREEFRERQKEVRESLARLRRGARAHGAKVERSPLDDDLAPAALRAAARSFGALSALSVPTNTKANDKTGDAAGAGQAEQSPAILGNNALCAWNDGQGFNLTPQDVQGYGWTTNGGATWTDGGIPPKAGTILTWSSDPVVSVNEKSGEFYYCGLTTNASSTNGVGVARGHFAGGTFVWDGVSVVASGPNTTQFFDKEWMCADSLTGNVYVTWTLFTTTGNQVNFARSTDGGVTWSAPLQVSGAWENGRVSGSRPMVGPSGELYVQYTAIGPIDADSVKIAKSTNGGSSFGPSVVAMTPFDNFFDGAPGFNRPRAVTFASGAVDRSTGSNRGRVYMTIQDCVNFYYDPLGTGATVNEVENNGNFANATPFTVGQSLRGSISGTTDQDWWSFPATQGTTYIFYVDSLRTTSFRYTMRLYCPNDTTVLSRLAFSGAQASNSALGSHSLIVWTAPTTNTYYLRMVPVTVGSSANQYHIVTGIHTPSVTDVARDTRDVVVASSADGVTGWTARQRVNDDAPLYDNWLPEVQVPCDGNPYVMWFDWRDSPASCFGGSNIYATRSLNGGATWAANVIVTDAPTPNWTQVASNIAPNQGDYNGLYGGDQLEFAWADGRLGDADVFTARDGVDFSTFCGNDTTVFSGTTVSIVRPITNRSALFPNTAAFTLTANRSWPGLPVSGVLNLPNSGTLTPPLSIAIPDTAANGSVQLCFKVAGVNGACAQTCCIILNVLNLATPALMSLDDASADAGGVHLTWSVSAGTPVRLERSTDGSSWQLLATLVPDGTGRVSYEDAAVTPGTRYDYRLGMMLNGHETIGGEASVVVPVRAVLALQGARPNPSAGPLTVSFSLADGSSARLELVDLNGRRVLDREVGGLGAGFHLIPLETGAKLPVGFYVVRLTQHGRTLSAKVSIVR